MEVKIHIVKRKNRFHYRRRLPVAVARRIGRSHVWKTLSTSDIHCAILRSKLYDKVIDNLYMLTFNVTLTVSAINEMLDAGLNNALTLPVSSKHLMGRVDADYGSYYPPSMFLNVTDNPLDESEGGEEQVICNAVQPMCGTQLSGEQGYSLLKGMVGILGQTYEPQGTVPVQIQPSPLGGALIEGATIQSHLGNYVSEMAPEAWTPRTRLQNERTLSLFADFVGDKPVCVVSRTDVSRFVDDVLRKLPKTYGKSPKDYDKRWFDLVVEDPKPGLVAKTINRHIASLSGFFRWCEGRGFIPPDSNPARGLRVRGKKRRARDERHAWSHDELKAYFSSPQYTGHQPIQRAKVGHMIIKDARYWVPYICLFAGLRLEEVAQLRVEDIEKIEGFWVFQIREGEGQRLKSAAATRTVPLHSRLIELGLLVHWSAQVDAGHSHVFPELTRGGPDGRFGYKLSQKLGTYRKQVGINRLGVDLHSLRGNFATALHDAGVPESTAAELLGHENASLGYARYSKGLSEGTLVEAIEKIRFDV